MTLSLEMQTAPQRSKLQMGRITRKSPWAPSIKGKAEERSAALILGSSLERMARAAVAGLGVVVQVLLVMALAIVVVLDNPRALLPSMIPGSRAKIRS